MLAVFKQHQERLERQRRWLEIANQIRTIKEQIEFLRTQRPWEHK